jgi:hypothetical protein
MDNMYYRPAVGAPDESWLGIFTGRAKHRFLLISMRRREKLKREMVVRLRGTSAASIYQSLSIRYC